MSEKELLEKIKGIIHAEPTHGNYLYDGYDRYVRIAEMVAEYDEVNR